MWYLVSDYGVYGKTRELKSNVSLSPLFLIVMPMMTKTTSPMSTSVLRTPIVMTTTKCTFEST